LQWKPLISSLYSVILEVFMYSPNTGNNRHVRLATAFQ
jgi:hypothetical protein